MRGNTVAKIKKQRQWSTKIGRKIIKLGPSTELRAKQCPRRGSGLKTGMPQNNWSRKDTVLDSEPRRYEAAALCAEQ